MGHKVHPTIYRIPHQSLWDSRWFARREQLPQFVKNDSDIREYLRLKLREAALDAVGIERSPKDLTITILAGKPGVIIGRGGQGLETLRQHIERNILQFKIKVKINVQPVPQPGLSATIVAENCAREIERRLPFRRVMKQTIERVMAAGAQGVKIKMGGRLNGVEIARREKLAAGKMSLITLRSNVDYALAEAQTLYGKIGIKVWVYHGEMFGRRDKFAAAGDAAATRSVQPPRRG